MSDVHPQERKKLTEELGAFVPQVSRQESCHPQSMNKTNRDGQGPETSPLPCWFQRLSGKDHHAHSEANLREYCANPGN
jgi:hypothetical protein